MDEKIIYGEVGPGGEVLSVPVHCAISGRLLESGDATVRIPGTSFSFGVKAEELRNLTPEKRAEIIAAAPKKLEPIITPDAFSSIPARSLRQSKESE